VWSEILTVIKTKKCTNYEEEDEGKQRRMHKIGKRRERELEVSASTAPPYLHRSEKYHSTERNTMWMLNYQSRMTRKSEVVNTHVNVNF
jgi:hypothetical protein